MKRLRNACMTIVLMASPLTCRQRYEVTSLTLCEKTQKPTIIADDPKTSIIAKGIDGQFYVRRSFINRELMCGCISDEQKRFYKKKGTVDCDSEKYFFNTAPLDELYEKMTGVEARISKTEDLLTRLRKMSVSSTILDAIGNELDGLKGTSRKTIAEVINGLRESFIDKPDVWFAQEGIEHALGRKVYLADQYQKVNSRWRELLQYASYSQ